VFRVQNDAEHPHSSISGGPSLSLSLDRQSADQPGARKPDSGSAGACPGPAMDGCAGQGIPRRSVGAAGGQWPASDLQSTGGRWSPVVQRAGGWRTPGGKPPAPPGAYRRRGEDQHIPGRDVGIGRRADITGGGPYHPAGGHRRLPAGIFTGGAANRRTLENGVTGPARHNPCGSRRVEYLPNEAR
jgi:hypothetical protein